jgi:uncharacterized Zn-finger protein
MKCDHQGCQQHFRKWHNFYNHLRFHTKEKPFVCPYFNTCGQSFSQMSNLNKHIKVHLDGLGEFEETGADFDYPL